MVMKQRILKIHIGVMTVLTMACLTFAALDKIVKYISEPSAREKACIELDPKYGHTYTPKSGPYRGIVMNIADLDFYYYEKYHRVSLYFTGLNGKEIGNHYYCNEIVEVQK